MKTTARSASLAFALSLTIAGSAAGGGAKDVETGIAAYTAKSLEGRKTASGERFDAEDMTAAHPTHEPGTRLKVTNLENQRTVEVRVIDHGPTKQNRREGVIIDVSPAAAEKLGFKKDGETRVRVERIGEKSSSR